MLQYPNFIIIGAQKSGTTWLVDMLKLHPEVFINREEVHYYDDNYHEGKNWYLNHFEEANFNQIIGEKTPDYFGFSSKVAPLIYKDYPSVKLILILRDPLERAISAYNHYVRMGKISPFKSINYYFENAIDGNDYLRILTYSDYSKNLDDFLKYFNREQIYITSYEKMIGNKRKILGEIEVFLSIKKFSEYNTEVKSNAFNKSFLSLVTNYYFPFLNPISKRLDKYLPNYKQKPSKEIFKALNKYLQTSIKIHNQV